jgi:hypothetical protein
MRVPFALGAVVLALAAGGAVSAPARAAAPCWKAVILDWSKDNRVDGRYAAACIRAAMANAPTDLKIYSSLDDDLRAAMRTRSVRRLAGVHGTASASIVVPSRSSALSPLAIVLAGLGVLVATCTAAALVRRRRAAS